MRHGDPPRFHATPLMAQVAIAKKLKMSQCYVSGFLLRYYMENDIYIKKNFPRPPRRQADDLFAEHD